MSTEAMKQALEALEWIAQQHTGGMIQRKAMEPLLAIKEALEQPAQEPVAYLVYDKRACGEHLAFEDELGDINECVVEPLYTVPPQRPWVGLTEDEIDEIWNKYCDEMGEASINDAEDIAKAIEAKLKEKNT